MGKKVCPGQEGYAPAAAPIRGTVTALGYCICEPRKVDDCSHYPCPNDKHAILNWTRECTCASNDKKRQEPEGHHSISARQNTAEADGNPREEIEFRNLLRVDKTVSRDTAPIALQQRDGEYAQSVEWLVNVPALFHLYFITTKDQNLAQLRCVVYKKCEGQGKQPPPISNVRGTVLNDYCVCGPKTVGRDISSTRDVTVEPVLPESSSQSFRVKRAVSALEDKEETREPKPADLHSVTDIVRCTTSCNSLKSPGYGRVIDGKCICTLKLNCAYDPCPNNQHAVSNGTSNCMCVPSYKKRQDPGACGKLSARPVIPELGDNQRKGTVSQNPLRTDSFDHPIELGSPPKRKARGGKAVSVPQSPLSTRLTWSIPRLIWILSMRPKPDEAAAAGPLRQFQLPFRLHA